MNRCLLVIALLYCVGTPLARGEDGTGKAKAPTIPFKVSASGHLIIKVKINGQGPYPVILDTGMPSTLLLPKVARDIFISAAALSW